MFRAGLIASLLLALLAATDSCGGSAVARNADSTPTANLDTAGSIGADGALAVLVPAPDGSYTLRVEGLAGGKAVYGSVAYDAGSMHLDSAQAPGGGDATTGTQDGSRILLVADQPQEGRLQFGMVLADWPHRAGIDGAVDIAQLRFAPGAVRAASAAVPGPPDGPFNVFDIAGSVDAAGSVTLTWLEQNTGDGNNDGIVTINDLTPLGAQITKPATDSVTRDADYNDDGLVTISDITPMGAAFQDSLGGYAIESRDAGSSGAFTEVERFDRDVAFPVKPPLGEVNWTWNSPAPITVDTEYRVTPYDLAGTTGETSTNTVTLNAPIATQTVTSIDDITFDDPNSVVISSGPDLRILITEAAVDATPNNVEPFSLENLQLHATVQTAEDPGNPKDGTDMVLWHVIDGGGLADVGNAAGSKGLLTFHDRGSIIVEAQASGNFAVTRTITFQLLTIDSLALELAAGGPGPVAVNAGDTVGFTATGTFDSDNAPGSGNEETMDLTPYVNWAVLADAGNTGGYSVDVGTGELDTTGAGSGDGLQVSTEFPRTDDVTLYDNLKRVSLFVRVDVN